MCSSEIIIVRHSVGMERSEANFFQSDIEMLKNVCYSEIVHVKESFKYCDFVFKKV